MEFKQFADAVNKQFLKISETGVLLKTQVPKEVLWETYQNSYSAEDNPIFRERRVHECNTCYNFIKKLGAIVSVNGDKLDTIWNIEGLTEPYQTVANTMHELVVNSNISAPFLTDEKLAGKEFNIEETEAGNIRWDHFYADIDAAYISQTPSATIGEIESTVKVFKRALDEFSIETLKSVIDLCDSIYRGEEFKPTVQKFLQAKNTYEESDKTIFIWTQYKNYPSKIRNSAIGTLIIDIQDGVDLEEAVRKYEAVVAPANYKRTSAVVTEGMKKQAIAKIDELGYRPSLPRRHAQLTDISVTNVLFANTSAKSVMKDELDELLSTPKQVDVPKQAIETSIDNFLTNILPGKSSIEALVENKHLSNFVSLVAPVNSDAPNMLKWNNNFSWSYKGEVTDAMKERVKSAGGAVDGVLRFSIQWNEENQDKGNDLDAYCREPNGKIIHYSNRQGLTGGVLDIDIRRPGSKTAVENITWPNTNNMKNGVYKFYVNDFNSCNRKGFRAQIEFAGELFEYDYPTAMKSNVVVAEVAYTDGEFSIKHHLTPSNISKEEWSINTKEYKPVSTIMLSPNYWDGQAIGNKHYFFMLEECQNPDPVRGFYNEFLSNELTPHRKVFEVLSSKMKCEPDEHQLSGLGFSSTQRNELFVKVDNIPYKIKF